MRISFLSAGVAIILYAASLPSHAQSVAKPAFSPIDAEAQITACRDKSKNLLAGTNADIREGYLDISLCLKAAIVASYGKMFSSNDFLRNDGTRIEYDIEKEMEDLRGAYGQLMWRIYNENDGCPCGTMYFSVHNMLTVTLFEDILRKMAAQQDRYPPKSR